MNTSRFVRRHKTQLAFGVLILGSLLLAQNDIKTNLQSFNTIKESIRKDNQKIQQLQQQTDFEKQQAKIAESRYSRGCLLVPNNLIQGQLVIDKFTKKPLPKNTTVCDINGNTGVLLPRDFDNDGVKTTVVAETAFSGNKALVSDSLKGQTSNNLIQK